MKYVKPYNRAMYIGVLLFTCLAFFLIEFATSAIIHAFYLHWLILGMALVTCCLPRGQQKLAATPNEIPRHSLKPWLLKILLLQLSLLAIYHGIHLIFQHWFLLHQPSLANVELQSPLLHFGLFPWALYALFAAQMGYLSYIQNKDVTSSELLKPILNPPKDSMLWMAVNHEARLATIVAVSTTFAMITLLLVHLLLPRSLPLHPGFQLKTMVIITMLILVGFLPNTKKAIQHLLKPKIPLYIGLSTSLILLALFIWLLNALFVHTGQIPIKPPQLVQWLARKNTSDLWWIFSATWWLAWTPVISAHFARLSRGHSIRSMILVILAFPTLLTLFITLVPHSQSIPRHYPISFSLLALCGFLYLLKQLTEKSHLPILIRSFLPKRDQYKRRDHYFFCRRLWQTTLMIIYLFLPTGMTVCAIAIFTMTLAFMLQIVIILIASLLRPSR